MIIMAAVDRVLIPVGAIRMSGCRIVRQVLNGIEDEEEKFFFLTFNLIFRI